MTITITGGSIATIESHGHAITRGDISVACAGVSALLRSFVAALGDSETVSAKGSAPAEGSLSIRIDHTSDEAWLRGAGDMLLTGLRQIEQEFPEDVNITVKQEM